MEVRHIDFYNMDKQRAWFLFYNFGWKPSSFWIKCLLLMKFSGKCSDLNDLDAGKRRKRIWPTSDLIYLITTYTLNLDCPLQLLLSHTSNSTTSMMLQINDQCSLLKIFKISSNLDIRSSTLLGCFQYLFSNLTILNLEDSFQHL